MESSSDKDREFDELFEKAKKYAGIDTILELQANYEKYVQTQNAALKPNRRKIIITPTYP